MPNVFKIQHQGKGYNTEQTFYEVIVKDIDTKDEQDKVEKIITKALKEGKVIQDTENQLLKKALNEMFTLIYDTNIEVDKSNLGTVGANLYQVEQLRKHLWEVFNLDDVKIIDEVTSEID